MSLPSNLNSIELINIKYISINFHFIFRTISNLKCGNYFDYNKKNVYFIEKTYSL